MVVDNSAQWRVLLTQRRFHAIMYGMDLIGLEKTGKMLEDRIAMVTTVQVKRVADNVEMVTDSLRIIIQTAADIVTAWKPRLMPKGDG